ncbi:hypothetical protein TIFTF001_009188 [Ficus carica]|uniref:PH domain-containing protein n=1 Tax=Ficus carica TaxID=3494 RepID=A0AA87ZW35_FICCA|nr:hypothetical protein TIFTF001_009188 [Ficus carica]
MEVSSCASKCTLHRLENIDENSPAIWEAISYPPPETPTESMEFLARSWSVSAMELSKALSNSHVGSQNLAPPTASSDGSEVPDTTSSMPLKDSLLQQLPSESSPPISPRGSDEMKELFLLHHALNPDFLSSQQLLKNGLYKSILRRKTMGRWLKDQKERKKQEIRTQNAQLHAAVSVAGVAAAVAALAAAAALPETSAAQQKPPPKTSAALASAAGLVASHCIEIAEEMGAEHDQILAVVNSAVNARTNGDIMTLTAAAATALRGAAILRTRLQKGYGTTTFALADEKGEGNESNILAGVVTEVCCDIPAWPGREKDNGSSKTKAYFGIKTTDRIIEFECRSKEDKLMWTDGIKHMLNCQANVTFV